MMPRDGSMYPLRSRREYPSCWQRWYLNKTSRALAIRAAVGCGSSYTDDMDRDHKNLIANDVTIVREPVQEPYGEMLVFSDLYGNLWDMIGPSATN